MIRAASPLSWILCVLALSCTPPETEPPSASGTQRMRERLAAVSLDPSGHEAEQARNAWAVNRPQRIEELERRLAEARDVVSVMKLRLELGQESLLAGRSEAALEQFDAIDVDTAPFPPGQKPQIRAQLAGMVGIAALRLAEQDNCVEHHTAESCLFPITGGGVHRNPRGALRAIEAFRTRLALDPPALDALWLLNLSYMTLGRWPDEVPAAWRLDPQRLASEYEIGRFMDVAPRTGLAITGLAGGSILEDFDGDGRIDVMASSWGLADPLRLLHNDGDGRFTDRSEEAGLAGLTGGLNLNHADYDNDGDPDVYVMRGGWLGEMGRHPNSLLRNNGDGTFDDVTEQAGLLEFHPSQTAAWADYDNDGLLDLFVGNEQRSRGTPHPCRLYRNRGDGRFVDVAPGLGLADLGFVKGAAWGDYDNDGLQDLYVSRIGRPNLLFRNADGGRSFTDVAERAGVREPLKSFPTWFWDYDNDGWLDLFVAAWDGAPVAAVAASYLGVPHDAVGAKLYRNNTDGTFRDVSVEAGVDRLLLTMGANFGDLDNDGFLDLYAGNGAPDLSTLIPNRMMRNSGDGRFLDVTTSGGFGHLQKGHGISFGDVDNDGDQDIHAVMGGWFSGDVYGNVLFENPGHGAHWITIRLRGTRSNRSGIGARIRVRVLGKRGPRDVYVTVSTGGSFGSSTLQQEIGLGRDARGIEFLEIAWPSAGDVQRIRGLELDRTYEITEREATARIVATETFALAR